MSIELASCLLLSSFRLGGIGVCLSLTLSLLNFSSRRVMYFSCVRRRDLFVLSLITSTPRNSRTSPKFFISKLEMLLRSLNRRSIICLSLANINRSSTWVAIIIPLLLLTYVAVSDKREINPSLARRLDSSFCHCLLACLRL